MNPPNKDSAVIIRGVIITPQSKYGSKTPLAIKRLPITLGTNEGSGGNGPIS